ncbi:MAG: YbjQ family protein [Cellulomonadaceae bacterium]|nr:YbjQ family protein [Cellulomonadaceae bacterium]
MKVRDIVKAYGIDRDAFVSWLKESTVVHREGPMGGIEVLEGQDIDVIVSQFREDLLRERERRSQEDAERQIAAQHKQIALANILITSGFNFDGYTITKYSGYISGDDAIQVDRGTGGLFSSARDVAASLMSSLVVIRRNALAELKEAAYALGCNAVIGVDFDYITLDPETAHAGGGTLYLPYVFGVTANGNAVIIEKDARVERG